MTMQHASFCHSLSAVTASLAVFAWALAIADYSPREAGTRLPTWAYDASCGQCACITYHHYVAPTRISQNRLPVLELQLIQELRQRTQAFVIQSSFFSSTPAQSPLAMAPATAPPTPAMAMQTAPISVTITDPVHWPKVMTCSYNQERFFRKGLHQVADGFLSEGRVCLALNKECVQTTWAVAW